MRHPASPLLDHCPESLPAGAYFEPDWFVRERDAIWRKNWLYAGRLNGMAPGTIRRVDLAGQNIILCRDASGALSAFHNTCRHRRAELCAEPEQPLKGRLITCPYHAWSYDTSGRLISTGFGTPTQDFKREEHGLFPVALREWNGFIYLCLAEQTPIFAPDLGVSALDSWPMGDLVTGHVLEKDLACNWKIFWENYNECLHCPGIHPELSKLVPVYRQGVMSAREARDWAPDAPSLREGARSWTMSGESLRAGVCGPHGR